MAAIAVALLVRRDASSKHGECNMAASVGTLLRSHPLKIIQPPHRMHTQPESFHLSLQSPGAALSHHSLPSLATLCLLGELHAELLLAPCGWRTPS